MRILSKNLDKFEEMVSAGLARSAKLARETAIKTNTSIVVMQSGKIVEITAVELKKEINNKN